MDTSSSSDSSFVLVPGNQPPLDLSLLASLSPYFPSISSPSAFNWTPNRLQDITQARLARPDQLLFIDNLLALLGHDGPSNYPPTSTATFNSLLFSLLTSPSTLQAHCIIFYLLLADSQSLDTSSPSPLPTAFARDFLLPTGFLRGIEGFHALDAGDWRSAVSALTDPHLTPDFVPKTFGVLATLPPVKERAGLVLSFWRLSGVALESVEEAKLVVQALCDQERKFGVVEAWGMQRKWADEEGSKELAVQVLASCFGDNANGRPVAHHLQALLSHPFTSAEDDLVTSFCLHPTSSTISPTLAADWRLSKYIAEGRPIDALRFWSQAKATVPPNDERERLLKAVHATLTEVQRNALALEADDYASTPSTASTSRAPAAGLSSTITQPAWQPVPPPAPTPVPTNLIATPRKVAAPIPQPQPSDLPLSASPFLRREKPLVSSVDGSALGGVQKSVLRALREGTSTSPFKTSTAPDTSGAGEKGKARATESPFASSASAFASPARDSFSFVAANSPRSNNINMNDYPSYPSPQPSSARKPTLSGFGSVRQQASAYGKARDESLTLFGPGGKLRYDEEMEVDQPQPEERARDDAEDEEHQEREQEHTFGFRAARDPAIAAMIAAATPSASANTSTTTTSKRRNHPSSSSATTTEKRRAVSTEPEERRPTGSVKTGGKEKEKVGPGRSSRTSRTTAKGKGKQPAFPGGFPGDGDAESDGGHDDAEEGEEEEEYRAPQRRTRAAGKSTTSKTTASTTTRRSARASSAQPQPPSTPQPKRASTTTAASAKKSTTTAGAGPETETPRPTRRSSRLQTPAKDEPAGAGGASARKTATGRKVSGRRGRIEEEEDE
ncbi:nuclear pore complex assembly-domain-containing protein [Leucosporidium creatinivorum]|uniref:Nuclear pore complex assembly-domain-containing protein n=1 Tax=Leucosporidium creatinivorum TaxID=106004 RepID=A0A1Y2G3S7_9BASI|nr:nuclear pore complex assembly-domain-containing protein [Leucosporidium creatinivorum]